MQFLQQPHKKELYIPWNAWQGEKGKNNYDQAETAILCRIKHIVNQHQQQTMLSQLFVASYIDLILYWTVCSQLIWEEPCKIFSTDWNDWLQCHIVLTFSTLWHASKHLDSLIYKNDTLYTLVHSMALYFKLTCLSRIDTVWHPLTWLVQERFSISINIGAH